MVHIPIVSRLSLSDYSSIVFTFVILGLEAFFRIGTYLVPGIIIDASRSLVEKIFPWVVTKHMSARAPPLESAANVQEMLRFWNYPVQEHLVRTQDNYLLGVHRITHGRERVSAKGLEPDPPKDIVKLLRENGVPLAADTKRSYHERRRNGGLDNAGASANSSNLTTHEEEFEADLSRKPPTKHAKDDEYIKPVVLLYHGFMMCSEVWLCNLDEERNLAFVLAEAGYDVWLGNTRGNKYSLKHMFLKPHEKKFWEFSMDELALFDLPDTVDYILNRTGAPSLVYIGFSQGTAQAFASLSINPDLNDKISLFIALAPATTPPGLENGLVNSVVKAAPNVIYLLLGRKTPLTAALFWQNLLHPTTYATLIDYAVKFLFGWNSRSMSVVQKAVSYQHLYSFTSVRILVHWFQIIRTQVFQMYDDVQPRVPYLSSTKSHCPHPFPTTQISTPIAIFYGGNDTLVDIQGLISDLPGVAGVWEVPNYEHLDFLWAEGLDVHVYPHILQLLESYSFNGHVSTEASKKKRLARSGSTGAGTLLNETRALVNELEGFDNEDIQYYHHHHLSSSSVSLSSGASVGTPNTSPMAERRSFMAIKSQQSSTRLGVRRVNSGQDQQRQEE
ncbi:cholesterol esterase [Lunasporangiospora selenospora]|uniref:Cholesterol esterase n=1 Tax=Lunasporangiospora selenospora TaxID=979761 RepID=A0A9P6FZM9_9FUNG|nr:cholesterol esterase [Lunasporangiospora selenospora]